MELLQSPTTRKEGDVEDIDDDDIGKKMNKQIPLKDLSPIKASLNCN